jgi:hypothetical protein
MEDQQEKYVLLKGKSGNVFWSLNEGENEGFEILFESSNEDEMIAEWGKYHPYVQI